MESLHNKEDEPSTDALFSFDFEKEKLDKARLQVGMGGREGGRDRRNPWTH